MSREMVNSGIPWIGDIPRKWRLSRYKFFATSRMGETILSEDTKECGIPVYSATQDGKIFGYVETSKVLLHKGDFVIPARGNSIGCISVVKEEVATCTQTTICSYNIRNINSSFLYYCGWGLKDEWFKFDGSAIPQITVSQVNNNLLPLPSIEEQQKIASFLDRKCAEIDEMIALQEKIVEELKTYKQSVITEAVTKGLNPDVPMKDSGIEWIGDIPEHWETIRVKYIADVQGRVGFKGYTKEDLVDAGEGAYTIGGKHITTNVLNLDDAEYISWEKYYESPEIMVNKGDIVFAQRGTLGRAAYIDREIGAATINPSLVLIKNIITNAKYLHWYLISSSMLTEIDLLNTSTAVPMISQFQINNIYVPHSPINEQEAIAEYLNTKCTEIDNLISIKLSKIDSLKEYKKSIIYEYVTGKKEVIE